MRQRDLPVLQDSQANVDGPEHNCDVAIAILSLICICDVIALANAMSDATNQMICWAPPWLKLFTCEHLRATRDTKFGLQDGFVKS